jgi:hypothetical protein
MPPSCGRQSDSDAAASPPRSFGRLRLRHPLALCSSQLVDFDVLLANGDHTQLLFVGQKTRIKPTMACQAALEEDGSFIDAVAESEKEGKWGICAKYKNCLFYVQGIL